MLRTITVLFVVGATVGNGYNSFHAYSGTIPVTAMHMNPLLDWSSYLLFGFAGLLIGMLTLFFDRILGGSVPAATALGAAGAIAFLGVFYFTSACMFLINNIILMILIGGFVLSFFLYDRRVIALLPAVLVAFVGTTTEILFVHYKMYNYARPQFMGVTYWLPFLYGIASITTGHLARALERKVWKQAV